MKQFSVIKQNHAASQCARCWTEAFHHVADFSAPAIKNKILEVRMHFRNEEQFKKIKPFLTTYN